MTTNLAWTGFLPDAHRGTVPATEVGPPLPLPSAALQHDDSSDPVDVEGTPADSRTPDHIDPHDIRVTRMQELATRYALAQLERAHAEQDLALVKGQWWLPGRRRRIAEATAALAKATSHLATVTDAVTRLADEIQQAPDIHHRPGDLTVLFLHTVGEPSTDDTPEETSRNAVRLRLVGNNGQRDLVFTHADLNEIATTLRDFYSRNLTRERLVSLLPAAINAEYGETIPRADMDNARIAMAMGDYLEQRDKELERTTRAAIARGRRKDSHYVTTPGGTVPHASRTPKRYLRIEDTIDRAGSGRETQAGTEDTPNE